MYADIDLRVKRVHGLEFRQPELCQAARTLPGSNRRNLEFGRPQYECGCLELPANRLHEMVQW